jgi:hypothetical protein
LSGEKSEGDEKMDMCSTGQNNPPLKKEKGIKRDKNNGYVSKGE